jgi:hypothetical protein
MQQKLLPVDISLYGSSLLDYPDPKWIELVPRQSTSTARRWPQLTDPMKIVVIGIDHYWNVEVGRRGVAWTTRGL